jgi:protoporphyrin/coproporphyrin ferrochelatase
VTAPAGPSFQPGAIPSGDRGRRRAATIDVAMLAFGGPESPAGIGPFIEAMTGGAPRPEVIEAVRRRYEAIGGGSPLPGITKRQAAALEAAMIADLGVGVRVRPGFLYCAPSVADCLGELDGSDTVALPMSPYSSRLTTGAYRAALAAAGRDDVPLVDGWFADRRYVAALSHGIAATLDGADVDEFAVLFTAHNVPLETVLEGDPYVDQLQQTVAQLVPALMPGDWRLAFQSKGRRGNEWLEPEAATAVRELAESGWRKLLVVPIGFVADHVETLYDLDIELRGVAESSGMDFFRSRAPNDSTAFITALADIVVDFLAHRPITGPVESGRPFPSGDA